MEQKTAEEWRDVKNYEGLYQISNYGRLRRWYPYKKKFKILKPVQKDGYECCTLSKNSIKKWNRLHRLVASAFLENTNNLPFINHKDAIRNNNFVNNLEWCNSSYNNKYTFTNGKGVRIVGEDSHSSKLKEIEVISIFKKSIDGAKNYELALEFKVAQSTISDILKGKKWKHIFKMFNKQSILSLKPEILKELEK